MTFKVFIQKIFNCLKSLFLRLRVIVTLGFGKEEVETDGSIPVDEDDETRERDKK